MRAPFVYKDDVLFCEDVSLREIALKFGTPCYVYSYSQIVRNYHAFNDAFSSIPHIIAYAVKANSNGAILRALAKEGSGADVVSGGELHRALAAGIPASRIVFAGVGKRTEELMEGIGQGILFFNVESMEELEALNGAAADCGTQVAVAIRVNPNVEANTHPHISTGRAVDKFGMPLAGAMPAYSYAKASSYLNPVGIHMHIGSQIPRIAPFKAALTVLLSIVRRLAREGIDLQYVDIGGGLGISYEKEPVPTPSDLAGTLLPLLEDWQGSIIVEPGRAIVGDAGLLLTEVLYRKPGLHHSFFIVDAGMNDLIRPALYNAWHRVVPVLEPGRETVTADIVGPICESADVLARKRRLPDLKQGEYLAVGDVGAYGFSMASNYNSRPRPAEVMVREEKYFLVRNREDLTDLTEQERIPSFLR
ncbi:MAG: diaminopimelate decarboxylase [Candidatus Bipolaricaulota bacterium]|nr:diaminopimelate decarboxylase [Candidatus Bipolaricaulota bacterium]